MRDALKGYRQQTGNDLETKPELQYQEDVSLALDTDVNNQLYDRGGTSITIVNATGQVYIRLNEPTNPLIDLNKAFSITANFYRFYLTWTAQAGLTATLLISSPSVAKVGILPVTTTITGLPAQIQQSGVTPTIADVAMAAANTEYSYALPTSTKCFTIHIKDDSAAYRVAYVTGKVAGSTEPYINMLIGGYYVEPTLLTPAGLTLYFASGTAGVEMEITSWV
jgi:hypothetical protein